jgi:hypothetical protein
MLDAQVGSSQIFCWQHYHRNRNGATDGALRGMEIPHEVEGS